MKHYLLLFTCLFLAFFTACDKVNVETGGNPVKPDTPTKPGIDENNKYYISMWNYLPLGERSEVDGVREWVDCGINLPMSFEYFWWTDKSLMLPLLDECAAAGIKIIVCDERTDFSRLEWAIGEYGEQKGLEEFKKGVEEAMTDFGDHPAVYGFHVGDEPNGKQWNTALQAFKIVQDANPSLTAFINMLPFTGEDDEYSENLDCQGYEGYKANLIDFIDQTGAKIISYDYYGQMSYVDKEYYQDMYMKNLRLFESVAKETETKLFVTLLSSGHLFYEAPDIDDFRWQLYTAVAHGAEGIHWFQFYELNQASATYHSWPVNRFGERTQTFEDLAYINRSFMVNFAEKLTPCKFISVSHFGKTYGGFPAFEDDGLITNITLKTDVFKDTPEVIITKWEDKNGQPCYTFVNMGREMPANFYVWCGGELGNVHYELWLNPGQMVYLDKNGLYNNDF